jgi:hypothetical protein
MDVAGKVALRFTGGPHGGSHVNLTAARADGEHLWVAGDETATIERLVLDPAGAPTRAGRQRCFRLADLVQLPGPANGEADIEGIAWTSGWLWAIGSHALVRRRPKPVHDDEKVVRRLGKLRRDPNRYVIVRLAVQPGVDRRPEPVRVSRDGRRSALVGAPGAENLVDLLRADTHLAPFLAIPGRDNGFEVRGLAAVGDRLYVGLRGPVLRGWAVVLEVRPVQDPTDPGRLALGIFPEGARYRKHFLELGGLGVRDLCPDGDDLLVLTGPTMALSGPTRVHRWRGAATARTARIGPVVRAADLPVELVVPHGDGDDHAEAVTVVGAGPHDPQGRLLVVYDAPAPARRPWADTLLADCVRLGDGRADEPVEVVPGAGSAGTVPEAEAAAPTPAVERAAASAEAEPAAPIVEGVAAPAPAVERAAAAPDAGPAAPTSGTEPAEAEGTASDAADAASDAVAGSGDAGAGPADVVIEPADPAPVDADPADPDPADPVDGVGESDGDPAAPGVDADTSPETTADGRARRSGPPPPPVEGGQPEPPATATGPDHRAVSASASTAGRSR